ncbi:hypothetical protein HPB50_008044 [Hyalomma asiaticum]|uniref:Uncharacterized protein n=1 Tax=Hyalomma asiaticum TaxID=266040 RepID=A0ACB7SW61_HYAAI|nr:hypothetical protein HPB50_008044 [Hyalomma asiaticum]
MASPKLVVPVQDASQAVRPASHPSNMRGFPKLAKQIALNVFEGLRVECGDSASVDALIKRTAKLTQVSERTLYRWKKRRWKTPAKSYHRRSVLVGKAKGEIPAIAKVVQRFKEDETLPTVSTTTMQRMLKKLGFRYKKRSRNALFIEATHIVQSRRRYLRQIAELRRQGRATFFADETWVNAGHTRSRVWIDGTVQSTYEARRSAEVFQAKKSSGDYHEEMNGDHYEKWFSQKLLPLYYHLAML